MTGLRPPARRANGGPRAWPDPRRRRLLVAGAGLVALMPGVPGLPALPGAAGPAGLAHAATPGLDEPPVAQPPRPLQLPPMTQHRLANGLTVVTVTRRDSPLVSVTLLLRVGTDHDPVDRPGVATMLATLLPKGARRGGLAVGASALARQAEALGNALVSDNDGSSLSLRMSVLSSRLPAALALMADVMRGPLLAADELERARVQALDALRVTLSNPAEVAALVARPAFWGATPYGRVGTAASLARLSVADLQSFHALHARPEMALLVLAGDVAPEQAALLAERLLGDWEASGALLPRPPATPPQPVAAPLVLVDLPGSGQSGVALVAPFAALGDADRRIGLVANAVLGGGYSARLNRVVRIERGLSYGAFSDVESEPPGGMLTLRAQTRHATAAEVLALMRGELRRMAEAPPSVDELAARQATLVGGFARRLQTTAGLASLAANQWVVGRPLADLQRYAAEVLAVTPAQVQAFARKHWAPEGQRGVVAGDLAAAGDGLGPAAQPKALRLPLARFDPSQPGLLAPD